MRVYAKRPTRLSAAVYICRTCSTSNSGSRGGRVTVSSQVSLDENVTFSVRRNNRKEKKISLEDSECLGKRLKQACGDGYWSLF